jgi:hypothetical protein
MCYALRTFRKITRESLKKRERSLRDRGETGTSCEVVVDVGRKEGTMERFCRKLDGTHATIRAKDEATRTTLAEF